MENLINRWLANIIATINAVAALLIVLAAMYLTIKYTQDVVLGSIIGGCIGALIAAVTCGVLALVIDIRNQLNWIATTNQALLNRP